MTFLTRHLKTVDESYLQHLAHASRFSAVMFAGAIVCSIHAVFPFLFENTGSRFVSALHDRMVLNRKLLSKKDGERGSGLAEMSTEAG